MAISEWIIIIGFLILVVISVTLLMTSLIDIANSAIYKQTKRKFLTALSNVLCTYYNTDDYKTCVYEIELLFTHIILSNERLNREYSNISIMLEQHLVDINAGTIVSVIEDVDSYKKKIIHLLEEYNDRNPLEQIKGADFVTLKQLIECLEANSVEKGKEIINQLAIQLKSIQDKNLENEKNSRKQDVISKVGIILSIVFGIMTFIQFFI